MDLSGIIPDVITHLESWEARAKKHDFRVLMAGEDSETSRHRADELRRCIKEIKMFFGIKEREPIQEPAPAKVESSSGPAPVPISATTTATAQTTDPAPLTIT